ncbi:MAG TPA: heme exporter protein CcmB [Vicinamibacterales bacterium]|jgi:heme exporter protein CcmB|nr:heme exporter protein CcmB [Vicinamibacterales bacterium]
MFARIALLVLKKDIAVELKSMEIVSTTLFFAVSCVLIFSFALVGEGGRTIDAAMVPAAILWIAVAFSGVLGLGRAFERERYGDTLKALLLAPAPRPAIYIGKLLGIVLLLTAAEALLVPMIAFIFHAPLFQQFGLLAGLLFAGTVGFSAVGTLFAAMLVRSRSREIMLPILLYPITIPVLIAGVRGTSALLSAPSDIPTATMWLGLLGSFDVVFLTLALWTFEPLMTE